MIFVPFQLDPAVQRWLSARAVLAAHDYFKVTPRTLFTAIFLVWGPIIGLGYMVTKSRVSLSKLTVQPVE